MVRISFEEVKMIAGIDGGNPIKDDPNFDVNNPNISEDFIPVQFKTES